MDYALESVGNEGACPLHLECPLFVLYRVDAEGDGEVGMGAAFARHRHLVRWVHHGAGECEVGFSLTSLDGDVHRIAAVLDGHPLRIQEGGFLRHLLLGKGMGGTCQQPCGKYDALSVHWSVSLVCEVLLFFCTNCRTSFSQGQSLKASSPTS